MLVTTYLSLGSNVGDRMQNLSKAVELLSEKVNINEISSVYETEPLGFREQRSFFNMVISAETMLEPHDLLRFVKSIEKDLGRKQSFKNAPRVIDIDILFYNDAIVRTSELSIPHPGIAQRAFVLAPLSEITSKVALTLHGKRISDLLAEVDGLEGIRCVGEMNFNELIK